MTSQEDSDFSKYLTSVGIQIAYIFSCSVPWLGLALSTFALIALMKPRRREHGKNLLIYIFKWRYWIAIVYWLNMVFNDPQFSYRLFNYRLNQFVSDPICKMNNLFLMFFYCVSPWMKVVITFDRLWMMYLENRLGIKRNKKNVTILILIVISFVFGICQIYMLYYVKSIDYPVFNTTLNKKVYYNDTLVCTQNNLNIVIAQDLIFVLMRIIFPFFIMVICNVVLIKHINKTRKVVIRGRKQKREHSFTIAVSIINGSFLVFNIGVVVYYFIFYFLYFSGNQMPVRPLYIFTFYGLCANLFSYIFTFSEFFIDMFFNKVFRKEIFTLIRFFIRFKTVTTSRCNSQETNL